MPNRKSVSLRDLAVATAAEVAADAATPADVRLEAAKFLHALTLDQPRARLTLRTALDDYRASRPRSFVVLVGASYMQKDADGERAGEVVAVDGANGSANGVDHDAHRACVASPRGTAGAGASAPMQVVREAAQAARRAELAQARMSAWEGVISGGRRGWATELPDDEHYAGLWRDGVYVGGVSEGGVR